MSTPFLKIRFTDLFGCGILVFNGKVIPTKRIGHEMDRETFSVWLATTFANRRRARGLTQEQAAALIGVSQSGLNSFESGDRIPRRETLDKIVEFVLDGVHIPDASHSFAVGACPHCERLIPVADTSGPFHHCAACGQRLSSHCMACDAPNPPDARYCMACGNAIPRRTTLRTTDLDADPGTLTAATFARILNGPQNRGDTDDP